MLWTEVNSSQTRTTAKIAQPMIERSGRPRNPPPSPPNRARLRRRKSSMELTLLPGVPLARRVPGLDGSPHGPLLCGGSALGGVSSPAGPQGPLLSLNRPRARVPNPDKNVMGTDIEGLLAKNSGKRPRSAYLAGAMTEADLLSVLD